MPSTRDFTPSRLGQRSALILFVPIFAILLGMTWYYYDYHIQQVNRTLTSHVARNIALYVQAYEEDPDFADALTDIYSTLHDIDIAQTPDCAATQHPKTKRNAYRIRSNIGDAIDRPFEYWVDNPEAKIRVCVSVQGRDDLVFGVLRKRMIVINSHIFIVWVIVMGVFMALVAYGFLRNQVRSILRLAEAAKAFGRARDMPDFKPTGAAEVREAARAVIDMKKRLTSFAQQRTAMLAGVSHDLRTPLTRLKLQFAMMDQTDETKAARKDLSEMEAMLDEYLAFAKGEDAETSRLLDVAELIQTLAESYDAERLTVDISGPVMLTVREIALQRALNNLIQNALHYGDNVRVSLQDGPRWLDILVDDDGPGIEKAAREEALQPFSRLDAARTQNKAGAGLGLSITQDAARAHGGELRLEDSPMGGLRARLRLPH